MTPARGKEFAEMPVRRFPPPWTVEEQPACFVVRDVNGEVLAYVYCEEAASKLLTKDEARRIATKYRQAAGAFAEGLAIGGLRDENT
jgi:hypothetical protein